MEFTGELLGTFRSRCPYYPEREAGFENIRIADIHEQAAFELIDLGFRHFGTHFFRPVCVNCHACVPIRIPVTDFLFSRNSRRVMNRNSDLKITWGQPEGTTEHFRIYTDHKQRFTGEVTEQYGGFINSFFTHFPFSRVGEIFMNDTLIGAAHIDEMDHRISAVYTYYDLSYSTRSIGKYAVLSIIQKLQERKGRYLYLGYYIENHKHMDYKADYGPAEVLLKERVWQPLQRGTGQKYIPEFRF